MEDYKIYVGGQFKKTAKELLVRNPFNQAVFARTWQATANELEEAIKSAEAVQTEMRELPTWKRYEILRQISDGLKINRDHLARVLSKEAGKPLIYALGEIDRATQTFLVAAEEAKRYPGEVVSLDWTPAGKGKEGYVKYFPVGLVAGISPFNFPMNLACHKIAPAIASGCPIVLKPASSTPLSTLELAKIIDQTDLPKGAVSILPMDRQTGNQLVTDERFKLLSFTGSPVVGWAMKNQAGKKKVVLELGGNAGVIVTESANLNKAVPKCIKGAFAYSGQVCIHAQRIYVQKKIYDDFLNQFIEGTRILKYGPPDEIETQITSMIDEDNAIRVEAWVNEAVSGGAKLLLGGKRDGSYYPPTILTHTSNDMKVCSLEVFGPVVVIEPYESFSEAIDKINDTDFGLQAGVFTENLREAHTAFEKIDVGGVIINDTPIFRVDHMPYGGVKDSGLGREGLKYSMLDMLEPKIMVLDLND